MRVNTRCMNSTRGTTWGSLVLFQSCTHTHTQRENKKVTDTKSTIKTKGVSTNVFISKNILHNWRKKKKQRAKKGKEIARQRQTAIAKRRGSGEETRPEEDGQLLKKKGTSSPLIPDNCPSSSGLFLQTYSLAHLSSALVSVSFSVFR